MCIIMAFSPPARIWYLAHTQHTPSTLLPLLSPSTPPCYLQLPPMDYLSRARCKLDQPIYMRMRKCQCLCQMLVWVPGFTGSGMPWPSKWITILATKDRNHNY